MSHQSFARVRRAPSPRRVQHECATFDPLPGRVVTTITVTRASDPSECVLRTAELDSWELRDTLPWVHATWPRSEGWAIQIDAKVAHA